MDATSTTSTNNQTVAGSSDTASTSYNAYAEMTAEQEFFLYELETTDSSSIGLVLRAIYDCGDVAKFARALDHRIRHYDRDIEKVCSFHYTGFVDAIRQLLQLTARSREIKDDANAIDAEVRASSAGLVARSEELVKYRKLQTNITTAIDCISLCLPVLDNYAKLQDLMKQKKYYQALRVLEELEHTYLAHVDKYRFTHRLSASIAPIRERIQEASFSEFTDFLETIRKVSARIGAQAMRSVRVLLAIRRGILQTANAPGSGRPAGTARVMPSRPSPDVQFRLSQTGAMLTNGVNGSTPRDAPHTLDDVELSVQDLIDFTPVHRCCQIFNVLDAKERFEVYYRKQRREQATVIIRPPSKLEESIEGYVRYVNELAGFFVVEEHMMQTEPGLVTVAYRDELWDMALQQLTSTMNSHFGNCLNVEMMLKMKKVILLFAITMKSYGFNIISLYKLLQNFRDQYNEILMSEYCAQFDRELEEDNYTPITVDNEAAFKAILQQFPFYKRAMDKEEYPRVFPFSQFVPHVFAQAKAYLVGCLKFMEDLNLSAGEMDDTVRRYANVILQRWSGSLHGFVSSKRRTLVQLVQITINMGYLEKSCELLGQYISQITNRVGDVGQGHFVALKQEVFRDARSEVELQIDHALRDKMEAFLELANYDWELSTVSGRSSDFVSDLIKFLSATFLSFTNLPPLLARHVCMQTCKYLASRLTAILLNVDVRALSPAALEQFNLDVMQCELFTAQCPVEGFEDGTLAMTFADLRQLLDLVMNSDWATYLADFGLEHSQYVRVKPQAAIALLEKMIEFEKKTSGFFAKGKEKDRKKLLDTILRQLRTKVAPQN